MIIARHEMAKSIEGLVDSGNERFSEIGAEDDAGLRNLEQNNRQLSLEISAVLKLLCEQYKGHDVFHVTHTFSSEITSTPSTRSASGRRAIRHRARRRVAPPAYPDDDVNLIEGDPGEGETLPSTSSAYQPEIFQKFINLLVKLERVAVEDILDQDLFIEFLLQFLLKYAQVFLVDPRNDKQWRTRLKLEVTEFVHSKSEQKLDHLFFLLRNDKRCDLLVFNVADASFYFYQSQSQNDNVPLARELVFFLRHLLHADQMVHALCTTDVPISSVFAAEMLLRIQFNAMDYRLDNPMLSLTQVVNLPSYFDFIAVILVSQFLIHEINEVEQVLMLILFDSSSLRRSSRKLM